MKKFALAAFLAVSVLSTAYATDENKAAGESRKEQRVNVRTLHNFRNEFGNLSDVEWSLRSDFSRATFKYNDESMQAFFDLNGELIGTSKAVAIGQLPVNVKRVFARRYADYTVTETIRFDGIDESSYYISAENGTKSVILKVSVAGAVSLYKSVKK